MMEKKAISFILKESKWIFYENNEAYKDKNKK